MSQPATAAEDAAFLLGLAEQLDPANTVAGQRYAAPDLLAVDRLREIAAHLQRIASGGDRRLTEGMPE